MSNNEDTSEILLSQNGNESEELQNHEYNKKLVNYLFPENVNATEGASITEHGLNDDNSQSISPSKGERSWADRTFSPITPGSLRGSTFTLISTALGAGVLSLPCMYRNTGLVLGTIFLLCAAGSALWSMYLLSKCSFRSGCQRYSDAVLQMLGKEWSLVLQFVLIIYVFGALVSYLITLNQFVAQIYANFAGIDGETIKHWYSDPSDPEYYHTYIIIAVLAVLAFPISSIKNLSGLRYLTIFSVSAIIYIIITVMWEAPLVYAQYKDKYQDLLKMDLVKFSWDSVTGWAVCAFAYTCHVNVFPVIAELQSPMEKRTSKIFNRCISVETCMYLCMGIAGYLSCLNETPDIFINRNATVGPRDIFMVAGKIAMAFNLLMAIPINLNPCRLQLIILLKREKKQTDLLHYGLTAGLIACSAALAMVFPKVYSAFGILGGFFATMLSYTFPSMIYLKCTRMKQGHYKRGLVILIGTLTTVFGFTSATVVILQTAGVLPSAKV